MRKVKFLLLGLVLIAYATVGYAAQTGADVPLLYVGLAVSLMMLAVAQAVEEAGKRRYAGAVSFLSMHTSAAWTMLWSGGVLAFLPRSILLTVMVALLSSATVGLLLDWHGQRAKKRERVRRKRTAPQVFK